MSTIVEQRQDCAKTSLPTDGASASPCVEPKAEVCGTAETASIPRLSISRGESSIGECVPQGASTDSEVADCVGIVRIADRVGEHDGYPHHTISPAGSGERREHVSSTAPKSDFIGRVINDDGSINAAKTTTAPCVFAQTPSVMPSTMSTTVNAVADGDVVGVQAPTQGSMVTETSVEAAPTAPNEIHTETSLLPPERAQSVVVVGGGLAGMVAALRLAEAGCRVTLLEGQPYLGGKVVGYIDAETGEAREHSTRVYMACYKTLLGVLNSVQAVGADAPAATAFQPVQMEYLPNPQSPPLDLFDLAKFYGICHELPKTSWALTKARISGVLHASSMQEWYDNNGFSAESMAFANAVMGVWTGAKPRSRASTILDSLGIVVLSMFNPRSRRSSLKERVFKFVTTGFSENQLYTAFPTSIATVEPIRRRLLEMGVSVRLGVRVARLRIEEARTSACSADTAVASASADSAPPAPPVVQRSMLLCCGVKANWRRSGRDGSHDGGAQPLLRQVQPPQAARRVVTGIDIFDAETGEALPPLNDVDAVVLAVDLTNARRLYPPAFVGATEDFSEVSGEWSVGCSFPFETCEDVPDFVQTAEPVPRMVLDSPWHIAYTVVKRDAFLSASGGVPFRQTPQAEVTIFATASNFEDAPGRLFGKPALLCTPHELKLEYLEQLGIGGDVARVASERGTLGLGVEFVSRLELQSAPWRYEGCALGPELEGDPERHRWVSRGLLFIETKHAPDVGTRAPGCDNLFLAGEYISSKYTTIKVPTMEKSSETGAMAARAAVQRLMGMQSAASDVADLA
eukprot:TRINITY_DN30051_c0_g1_i1.p1 TRINITY_DN30051_c0_g1~~TRINITY_DN30051_c0_g1_i1.p1  ORF type:complete len:802 (+),score=122.66 TRINITY_DN30051_c0_g1_i1:246-2651(+)